MKFTSPVTTSAQSALSVVKSKHLFGKIWHTGEDDNRIVLRDLVASFFCCSCVFSILPITSTCAPNFGAIL